MLECLQPHILAQWTRNSVVECFIHIEEVVGANPTESTKDETAMSFIYFSAKLSTCVQFLNNPHG
jgi:hypothetical protein